MSAAPDDLAGEEVPGTANVLEAISWGGGVPDSTLVGANPRGGRSKIQHMPHPGPGASRANLSPPYGGPE
jgi:hypothetical protein